MTIRKVLLLIAIALLLDAFPTAAAAAYTQVGEIVRTVNFRDAPTTSGNRIRYLRSGEQVEILRQAGKYWLEVKDVNGQVGYVSSSDKYIQQTTRVETAEPNGQIISTVSFRTGPSTRNERIRYLRAGELVTIIEKVNTYWYKAIDRNQVVGYLSTNVKYIDTAWGEAPQDEESTYVDEPDGRIVKTVSFRTGPSTEDRRIRYLYTDESIWILDKINAYWLKVKDKNGVTGYVSASRTYVSYVYAEEYKQWDRGTVAERAIQAGLAYLGTPYEFGSSRSDTSTFDCSDFVRQAFLDGINYRLPGDSRSQGEHVSSSGNPVITDWRQLQRGDLMFFMANKGYQPSDYEGIDRFSERITHVGIYLGNGEVLHTYSVQAGGVTVSSIANTGWEYRFLYGGYAIPASF